MNYDHQIDKALNALHAEGRYRVFQDISRINGEYPKANWVQTDGTQTEITVWCGNDYLGMGQNKKVLSAIHLDLFNKSNLFRSYLGWRDDSLMEILFL